MSAEFHSMADINARSPSSEYNYLFLFFSVNDNEIASIFHFDLTVNLKIISTIELIMRILIMKKVSYFLFCM